MTIRDYSKVLREQWLVLVVAIVLGLGGAAAVYTLRPAEYTANLTMYVSSQSGETTSAAYQGAQLSQQRIASYVALVTSPRIGGEVVRQLGLPDSPYDLTKRIRASSAPDSVLIQVAVVDESATRAAAIANAVGDRMVNLVNELERSVQIGGNPAVAARVVQPAEPPLQQSSTGLPTVLLAGFAIGVGVGAAGALVRNALDTSVRSSEQLEEATGAPLLGCITYNSQTNMHPVSVHDGTFSASAEAYKQLRTNLQFIDVDNPHKVLVMTSALPSEGKTTTIVNLAVAMASAGMRVLVVDADLRRPKIATMLQLEQGAGLTSVLTGRLSLRQAIQTWGGGLLDVLTSGLVPPNPSELLASMHMRSVMADLRGMYDIILVDSPPLIPVTDAAAVAPISDGVILLCQISRTTTGQVKQASEALKTVSAPLLGTVLTMVKGSSGSKYDKYSSYHNVAAIKSSTPRTAATTRSAAVSTSVPIPVRPSPRPSPGAISDAAIQVKPTNGR